MIKKKILTVVLIGLLLLAFAAAAIVPGIYLGTEYLMGFFAAEVGVIMVVSGIAAVMAYVWDINPG